MLLEELRSYYLIQRFDIAAERITSGAYNNILKRGVKVLSFTLLGIRLFSYEIRR